MWPSAADKKEETGKIQWLSKTKEEKERAIERELDNEDEFDSDYVQPVHPRKQPSDDRPLNSKFAEAAKIESQISEGPKTNAVNIDDIPIPTANATKPKSFNDLL